MILRALLLLAGLLATAPALADGSNLALHHPTFDDPAWIRGQIGALGSAEGPNQQLHHPTFDDQSWLRGQAGLPAANLGLAFDVMPSGDTSGAADAAAINTALTAACALNTGGTIASQARAVRLGFGKFYAASTIVELCSGVVLSGQGRGSPRDAAPYNGPAATTIVWTGSAGGKMISVDGSGTTDGFRGNGVTGVSLVCSESFGFGGAASAGWGLYAADVTGGKFDTSTYECTTAGAQYAAVNAEFWRNEVTQEFRQINQAAPGVLLTGDGSVDVALNHFAFLGGQWAGAPGIDIGASDNNWFGNVSMQQVGTGVAGVPMIFRGGATAPAVARANTFENVTLGPPVNLSNPSLNIGIKSEGTDAKTVAAYNNKILVADYDNVFNTPALGTGSTLTVLNGPMQALPVAPTVTCGSGAFGTPSPSATGKAQFLDKHVKFSLTVTIPNNGTCAGYVGVTAPVSGAGGVVSTTPPSTPLTFPAINTATSHAVTATMTTATNVISIINPDSTYPAASGSVFVISGEYVIP